MSNAAHAFSSKLVELPPDRPRKRRARKPHGTPSQRKVPKKRTDAHLALTDAVLLSAAALNRPCTSGEMYDYAVKSGLLAQVKKHSTVKGEGKYSGHDGSFRAYCSECRNTFGFFDDLGKAGASYRYVLTAHGHDRINGIMREELSPQAVAGVQLALNLKVPEAKKPLKDTADLTRAIYERRLRAAFDAARQLHLDEATTSHIVPLLVAQEPFIYVSKFDAQIMLTDPAHPFYFITAEYLAWAKSNRLRLIVRSEYDGSPQSRAISIRFERIPVQVVPDPAPEPLPESLEVVQDTKREHVASMLGRQIEIPGLFQKPDKYVYDLIEAEMRRVGSRRLVADREAFVRGSVVLAWNRLCEFTRSRHNASKESVLNEPIDIRLAIPTDIENPTNPYYYAIIDITAHALSCGFRLETVPVSGGFTVRFVVISEESASSEPR